MLLHCYFSKPKCFCFRHPMGYLYFIIPCIAGECFPVETVRSPRFDMALLLAKAHFAALQWLHGRPC